jgi:hypothetical protein
MADTPRSLFPTLSEVASRTDALREVEDDDARIQEGVGALIDQEEGEEREMHEIESLCMRCQDQVGWRVLIAFEARCTAFSADDVGSDEAAPHDYSLLQGDCGLVFQM